ncbi:MAG: NADH-quinone oxidoreductase subunit L [Alphaproteobacteria bacterium]
MYSAIVFLPLIGAFIAGFFGRWIGDRGAQAVTCGGLIIAALLSLIAFVQVTYGGETETVQLFTWIDSGAFEVGWALRIDQLTAVMLVVVTVVSAVVHVYSVGYMSHDPHKPRFMAYLSLFTFFMLMLVTADNFVQMFFGWEGVGLSSYLLIGFWFKRPSANAAAIKAFLVNRVGDFGFGLGIFAIFMVYGSVDFDTVFAATPEMVDKTFRFLSWDLDILTTICLLLFVGAMGKSAQVPLHTWLPDAMEGPTPVSALIHAATMVTAGVFMVARCSPMFEYAPIALLVVACVGAFTAFFAATVGLVQTDIKRVIAYSTCSQLGYMFFACGVSAYQAAIFHLFTHAFFKALLFLGAGCVIHAMSDEQDMRKMGGIRKMVPITYALMWIGSLALVGFPLTAGFFSKDMVLEAAFGAHTQVGMFAFTLGIAAAVMTSFYSFRLLFMTFHGEPRASHEVMHHVHESPWIMLGPLFILAAGALFAGLLFYVTGGFIFDNHEAFWGESIKVLVEPSPLEAAHHVPLWVKVAPFVAFALGLAVAWWFYIRNPKVPASLATTHREAYLFILNKWYWDELFDLIFVRPAKWVGRFLWRQGDGRVIDGFGPDGIASTVLDLARRATTLQTGFIYHYAFAMLIGVAALVTWFFGRGFGG